MVLEQEFKGEAGQACKASAEKLMKLLTFMRVWITTLLFRGAVYRNVAKTNSKSIVSHFALATAIGQCSSKGSSSGVTSNTIVEIDVNASRWA